MSLEAAADWEATGYIFDDEERYPKTTTLDNEGGLLRASIDLTFRLDDTVFCRRVLPVNEQQPKYRFWTLPVSKEDEEEEGANLKFRLVFWCRPNTDDTDDSDPAEEETNSYYRLEVSLLSEYPHSFPQQELKVKWLKWIQKAASQMLLEEQISYSVCSFVEHQALDYFPRLLQEDQATLICFEDEGPVFYDMPTLVSGNTVKKLLPLQRHLPNGRYQTMQETCKLTPRERELIVPIIIRWRDWLPTKCPICFDTVTAQEAALLPCNHGFCKSCLTIFLRMKADEIHADNSNNPFVCPLNTCRRGLKIIGFVKPFLSESLMDKVRLWYKDIKTPPCYSLPGCLKKDCKGSILRKDAVDSFLMSCEICNGRWCELCLQRAPKGKPHEDTPACKVDVCQQFCERYLAAGEKAKQACEERFPWVKLYAASKVHDNTILLWIQNNGQVCPGCKTGVERSEGCFHMSCGCGTHFCYECGEQIFPPFYGTHHCWEREQRGDFFRVY